MPVRALRLEALLHDHVVHVGPNPINARKGIKTGIDDSFQCRFLGPNPINARKGIKT